MVEVVGFGEDIDQFGLKVGDRVAVANQPLCPIIINCKQYLVIYAMDVIAKIENWTEEQKVKTVV